MSKGDTKGRIVKPAFVRDFSFLFVHTCRLAMKFDLYATKTLMPLSKKSIHFLIIIFREVPNDSCNRKFLRILEIFGRQPERSVEQSIEL